MEIIEPFAIGEIVTLKSHPLNSEKPNKIIEFPSQVPPLMLVKEIFFEDIEKKKLFSSEIEKAQIADYIKYNCVFFNANKSEFQEKIIYHSLLVIYLKLEFFKDGADKKSETEVKLVDEVISYDLLSDYIYGDVVQFKTKKLEHRKSYDGNNERIRVTSNQTPDFVVSGIKKNEQLDLFYLNGKNKKIIPLTLFKVMWFNPFQQKFSEYFLPKEFFVKNLKFNTEVKEQSLPLVPKPPITK